ncbi:MAG: single-stranded DNA-binding protein [Oscillospiraceae bacterium]|jgi:single-strand DNA-binding protein|nr:single-stranded DNA-binding protein [Oscillospiraceae bacterium]
MNKVFLIGNLTRDPEMRTTAGGIPVCSFGLAVNRRRKVEGQPDADFFNITAWRQLGENCARYLTKGRKVCVVGAIQLHTFDGQDGTRRSSMEVTADDVEFMPNAQSGEGSLRDAHPAPGYAAPAPRTAPPTAYAPAETGFTQVDEDELPF